MHTLFGCLFVFFHLSQALSVYFRFMSLTVLLVSSAPLLFIYYPSCYFILRLITSMIEHVHNSLILPQVETSTLSKRILLLPGSFVTVILITLYDFNSNGISSPGLTFGAWNIVIQNMSQIQMFLPNRK